MTIILQLQVEANHQMSYEELRLIRAAALDLEDNFLRKHGYTRQEMYIDDKTWHGEPL